MCFFNQIVFIVALMEPCRTEMSYTHEKRQNSGNIFKMLFIYAILPEKISYIRFGFPPTSFMQFKLIFKFCGKNTEISYRMCLEPGALKIEGIRLAFVKI